MSENPENYQVRAVSRALSILSAFSVNEPELGLIEISKKLDLHKTTVLRLLDSLRADGFIEMNESNGRYRLGIKTFEVGSIYYLTRLNIDIIAKPIMEEIAKEYKLTTVLAILDKSEVFYIGITEPNRILRVNLPIGFRFGIHHTSLGKVLVSDLPEDRLDSILLEKGLPKVAPKTITDEVELKKVLADVRKHGFAVDDEESFRGIRCVAAPIRDRTNKVIAALSVSGTIFDVTTDRVPVLVDVVKNAANKISEKLGFIDNPSNVDTDQIDGD